jgi:hypothetical protein
MPRAWGCVRDLDGAYCVGIATGWPKLACLAVHLSTSSVILFVYFARLDKSRTQLLYGTFPGSNSEHSPGSSKGFNLERARAKAVNNSRRLLKEFLSYLDSTNSQVANWSC